MNEAIPVIDIAPFRLGQQGKMEVARAVGQACSDLGFLVISGHGVSPDLVDAIRRVSRAYFALPDSVKIRTRMPPDRYRGYILLGNEALAYSLDNETPPDIKESFSIGPTDAPDDEYHRCAKPANFFAENLWPEEIEGFRETYTCYYKEMERVAALLMRIFAVALDMPESYFVDKIDHHISNFSVIHYPDQATPPLPGQLRAGAHTDYGSLTIVKPDAAPGGLQVLGKSGNWIDVPHIEDTLVVNLGDLMAEWTNDRWVSTLHRVVNPPAGLTTGASRLSTAFFHQPNYDAVIACLPNCSDSNRPPRYNAVTSGEHVWTKITKHRQPELSEA